MLTSIKISFLEVCNPVEISIPVDVAEEDYKNLYDVTRWTGLKLGIFKISKELKDENDLLNDFMLQIIFNKYKQNTGANCLTKTITGYTLLRRCHKYKYGCKIDWHLKINIFDKSARLERQQMCNHFSASIGPLRTETGYF